MVFFLICFLPLSAQRIEVHGIKDLSNNSIANKAWGVGGAIYMDQWVKKTAFGVHFDWTTYRPKNKASNHRFNRMTGGVTAYYSLYVTPKISLLCGAAINYTNLQHSYIYTIEKVEKEKERLVTVLHKGHFIGVGPYVGVNYDLSKRFGVKLYVIPTYLISVGSKSSLPEVKSEYAKGIWIFPLQLGITYKIFSLKE